jgi:hypothetical protein
MNTITAEQHNSVYETAKTNARLSYYIAGGGLFVFLGGEVVAHTLCHGVWQEDTRGMPMVAHKERLIFA